MALGFLLSMVSNQSSYAKPHLPKILRAAVFLSALISTLFGVADKAFAAHDIVTILGTVGYGTDQYGNVFNQGTNLTGAPYTLTFTFNDALGTTTSTSTSSEIQSTPSSNPGTATLTINGVTVPFGVATGALAATTTISSSAQTNYESEPEYLYKMYYIDQNSIVGAETNTGYLSGSVIFAPCPGLVSWETPANCNLNAAGDGGIEFYETSTSATGQQVTNSNGTLLITSVKETGPLADGKNLGDCGCGGQTGSGTGSTSAVGDPIDAGTGNLFEQQVDFVPGENAHIGFVRYYNSQDMTTSGLGIGWHSAYHRLLLVAGSTVTVTRADGRQDTFTKSGAAYVADPDVTSVLVPIPATETQTGYKLTLSDDTVETYNISGQLVSIATRNGLVTTLSYAGANVTTVTGPFGQKLEFAYSAAGNVDKMTLPDGGVYTYAYSAGNNLTSVTYPDKTVVRYVYADASFPNLLTSLVDQKGTTYASWTYDSTGRALSSEHAGGADKTTVVYNASGTSTVTDADGNARTYVMTTLFQMKRLTSVTGAPYAPAGGKDFAYSADGFISSKTDFDGHVTTYVNNAEGEETSRTEAAGTAVDRTITTAWETGFHLPKTITEPLRTREYTYDAHGNVLSYGIVSGALPERKWTYSWYTTELMHTASDPNGNETTFVYNANGTLDTATDALGHVTKYTLYDADGRLKSKTDPNGLVTQYAYDALGRLLSETVGTLKTTFTYDATGNLTQITHPDSSYLRYAYDAAHRLISKTDTAGDSEAYTLDAAGNLIEKQISDPSKAVRLKQTYSYDDANRLHEVNGAIAGETTIIVFDAEGNLTSTTDPLSHVTTMTYDALNRRTTLTDANKGITTFGYDADDHIVSVKDPRGLVTEYTVNGLDETTELLSPDTGTTKNTSFDLLGHVLSSTDARGKVTTYTYDKLNRPKTIDFADGTGITYTYDAGTYGIGHLTSMADPAGTTSFLYDEYGRLLQKSQLASLVTLRLDQSYDSYGRLLSKTYPSGKVLTYTYDTSGRVSGITDGVTEVAYFPFGPAESWAEENGQTYARTFDDDGRITKIATGGTANVQTLAYNLASEITGLTETGLAAKTYTYDDLDRLTELTNGTVKTQYAYDADGNRSHVVTSAGTTTYNYPATSNHLTSLTGIVSQPKTYDLSGNQESDGAGHTFTYNDRGRLASVTDASVTTSYGIDAVGERISKTGSGVAGGSNEYMYDTRGHLIGEYDHAGTIIEETVFFADTPVAVLTGTGGVTVSSISSDWLNAPHIIANSTQKTLWTWDHLAFGDNGPNQDPDKLGTFAYNNRFPGQYADTEAGQSYNVNRDYNPTLGRYIQSDPIGLNGGINSYGYVGGNPIGSVDGIGLCPMCAIALPIIVVGLLDPNINDMLAIAGGELGLGGIIAGKNFLDSLTPQPSVPVDQTEGAQCRLTNTTDPRARQTNYSTDQTPDQMMQSLEDNGYQASSPSANVTNYTNGNVTYTFYPARTSVPGSSGVQITVNGSPITKITPGQ